MAVTIRKATKADLPEMYKISVYTHQTAYEGLIPEEYRPKFEKHYESTPEHEQKYNDSIGSHLDDPNWYYWVAEEDGKILGYTLAEKENEHLLHKKGLFVHPDAMGKGVGSALFEASLEPIDTGIIDLVVIEANKRAQHIYEKNGFKVIDKPVKMFYGAPQVVMQLEK